jgi:hypothetical protein
MANDGEGNSSSLCGVGSSTSGGAPSLLLPTPPVIRTWDRGSATSILPSAVGGLTRCGCHLGRRRSDHAAVVESEDSDATSVLEP